MGFNMLDPVVGGDSERARKLRQAISIAMDFEEYIGIFANGRGIPAQGPIPPAMFGHRDGEAGINRYVYDWVGGKPQRKSIAEAKQLLAEAGYPDGIDGDRQAAGAVPRRDRARARRQGAARLDPQAVREARAQLVVRATDYNRFQDKIRKGNAQIFQWGWNADYPDPENFLFLLTARRAGRSTKARNAANYANPEYDRLFERMKNMENGPERQAIIDQMLRSRAATRPGSGDSIPRSTACSSPGCST